MEEEEEKKRRRKRRYIYTYGLLLQNILIAIKH